MKVNVEGTANVCNIALTSGVKKLCHLSSTAAIGRSKKGEWISEENEWKSSPLNTRYAVSKHSAELEVWRAVQEGLACAVVNPSIVIGPGNFSRSSAVVFDRVAKGVPFYPTGANGFVGVKDVARACIALARNEVSGERFILNAENRPYQYVVETIAEKLGVDPPKKKATTAMLKTAMYLSWLREKFGGPKNPFTRESIRNIQNEVHYNSDKIRAELNFEFGSVDEAIAETAEFYRFSGFSG